MVFMAKTKNRWGKSLKRLRESRGPEFTQARAAAALGVPLRTYQNWEQGHAAPPDYVRRLVERLLSERS